MDMRYFFTPEDRLPPDAGFSLWGREHLCWLLIAAALTVAACLVFRRASRRGKDALRRGVGGAVLALEVLKNWNLWMQGSLNLYFLPLHLCSLAVFFTFFHSLRPGALLGNFLYSTCMPGALSALLFPDWTVFPAFSFHAVLGFLSHTLLTAYPLMLLAGGDLRPEPRRLPGCLALLAALAAAVYAFDRAFSVNYMFLLLPAPGSPLEWFAALWGNPGYQLGFLPLILSIWGLLYLPFLRREGRKNDKR